jgi:selenocysteine lyase/cysteine desulfurase
MDFNLKPNAQRYEEGSPNGLGIVGLNADLGIILEVGIDAISNRIFELTEYAIEKISQKNYRVASPLDRAHRAGIVLFDHHNHGSDLLFERLKAANVKSSIRNGRIRLSPHFYNTEEEIDIVVSALP